MRGSRPMPDADTGNLLLTGAAITGAGAAIAIVVLSVRVVRTL